MYGRKRRWRLHEQHQRQRHCVTAASECYYDDPSSMFFGLGKAALLDAAVN